MCVLDGEREQRDSELSQSCVITQTASSGLILDCGCSGLKGECLPPVLFSRAAVNNSPKKGITLVQMLYPIAGIVFPQQNLGHGTKGVGNVGGWDLEQCWQWRGCSCLVGLWEDSEVVSN